MTISMGGSVTVDAGVDLMECSSLSMRACIISDCRSVSSSLSVLLSVSSVHMVIPVERTSELALEKDRSRSRVVVVCIPFGERGEGGVL